MNIINHGNKLRYKNITYVGECMECGCTFATDIEVAEPLTGTVHYRPTEYVNRLSIAHISGQQVTFMCDCPECGRMHVTMNPT